jgi:hypothetical protein
MVSEKKKGPVDMDPGSLLFGPLAIQKAENETSATPSGELNEIEDPLKKWPFNPDTTVDGVRWVTTVRPLPLKLNVVSTSCQDLPFVDTTNLIMTSLIEGFPLVKPNEASCWF